MSQGTVLCIGGANVDRKLISQQPLQSGTSNPVTTTYSLGGVARNVAENLARLGLRSTLWTLIGQDAEASLLLNHTREAGIDVSGVEQLADERTGSYTAVLLTDGSLALAFADMAIIDRFSPERFDHGRHRLAAFDWVVIDTNLPADTLATMIADAQTAPYKLCVVPVSVPKVTRLPPCLEGVSLLICNRDEAHALAVGTDGTMVDTLTLCHQLQQRGCDGVIITDGTDGVTWRTAEGATGHVSAQQVTAVDVTGAGDAFAAGVVSQLVLGHTDLSAACTTGVRLAAATTQSAGTVMNGRGFADFFRSGVHRSNGG